MDIKSVEYQILRDKSVEIRYEEWKMKLDMCRGFGWICVDLGLGREMIIPRISDI